MNLIDTNFNIDESMHQLLELDGALQAKKSTYRIFRENNIPQRLSEILKYTEKYRLTVFGEATSVPQNLREHWVQAMREQFEELDIEYYDTISKVYTTRTYSTLIGKYQDCYIMVTTRFNENLMYKFALGMMLLDYKDNEDFVRRVSTAIQDDELLVLTESELTLITNSKKIMLVNKFIDYGRGLMDRQRPGLAISEIKRELEYLVEKQNKLRSQLQELMLLDFAIIAGNTDMNEKVEELKEYIKTIQDKILDLEVTANNTTATLTLKSWMYIPTTAEDYFKEDSLNNERHDLYRKHKVQQLMKDVMAQTLRVPILAHYRLRNYTKENGLTSTSVEGIAHWRQSQQRQYLQRNFAENMHVTQYNCFDGYRSQMNNAINDKDLIGLLEIALVCTGSINVFDSFVIGSIIQTIEMMHNNTELQIRTDNGWENIKLEDYYAKIENGHQ